MAWLLILLGMAGPPEALILAERAVVARGEVRLSDLADLSCLPGPLADRAALVVVGQVPRGETRLSSREVAERARAALPGLGPWLSDGAVHPIRIARTDSAQGAGDELRPEREQSAGRAARIRAGDPVTVRVIVGPVTIERKAQALQPGWAGRSVFVRTSEGSVLAARLEDVR